MSLEHVQQGLLNTAKTLFESLAIPVAWENVTFEPPEGPWAYVSFEPASSRVGSMGPSGQDKEDGFLQIDLSYPKGSGEKDMRQRINDVKTCFYTGRSITYASQPVTVLSTSCSGGRVVDSFYRKSVTIRWRAFITRPPTP